MAGLVAPASFEEAAHIAADGESAGKSTLPEMSFSKLASHMDECLLTVPFKDVEVACLNGIPLPVVPRGADLQSNLSWILLGAGTNGEYSGGDLNTFPWTCCIEFVCEH